MKLKILGTSNGFVVGGYGWWLGSNEAVEIVANYSIGASHPCLVPLALEDDSADIKGDVFLLDLCVNEQRARGRKLYNGELSALMLDEFLLHCRRTSILPLILLLPTCVRGKLTSDATAAWKALCDARRVPYLDVAEIVPEGDPPWKDLHHPDLAFSGVIAQEIVKHAQFLKENPPDILWPDDPKIILVRPKAGTEVHRSTSLASKDMIRLTDGETFDLRLEDGSDFEVLGLSHNMAKTHASLKFSGQSEIIQRLDSDFYNEEKELWFVSWSLPVPVRSDGGSMTVTVVAPEASAGQIQRSHQSAD